MHTEGTGGYEPERAVRRWRGEQQGAIGGVEDMVAVLLFVRGV